jgi:N4-gp56 family major capsid protein
MANESTSTTLNDLLPAITAEAMFVASERSVISNLVKRVTLPAGQGKTVTIPRYPVESAGAITEGTALANTQVATDGTTVTIGSVGITSIVTDLAVASSASNVVSDIGRLFGEAIAKKVDTDLAALFSGFTTNTVGDEDSALTAAKVMQAVAKLRAASVPADDIALVVHPFIAYDLKDDLTATFQNPNMGNAQNDVMINGYVGRLFGVPVFESANIGEDSTGGEYTGGLFHRDALALAQIGDLLIETQRDLEYVGTRITGSMHYGVAANYEQYGCAIIADSSIA